MLALATVALGNSETPRPRFRGVTIGFSRRLLAPQRIGPRRDVGNFPLSLQIGPDGGDGFMICKSDLADRAIRPICPRSKQRGNHLPLHPSRKVMPGEIEQQEVRDTDRRKTGSVGGSQTGSVDGFEIIY